MPRKKTTPQELPPSEDDVLELARQIHRVAHAIFPQDAAPSTDRHGGYIASLTEAVMSCSRSFSDIASALDGVASALDDVANAIADHKEKT